MPFVFTCDIFCGECGNWKHGDTRSNKSPSTRKLWKRFLAEGWERRKVDGKIIMVCPVCLGKTEDYEYYPKTSSWE